MKEDKDKKTKSNFFTDDELQDLLTSIDNNLMGDKDSSTREEKDKYIPSKDEKDLLKQINDDVQEKTDLDNDDDLLPGFISNEEIDDIFSINKNNNVPTLESFRIGKGKKIVLHIPSNVEKINIEPFSSSFDIITVDKDNKYFEVVDNALYTKGRTALLRASRNVKSFTVDNNTKIIKKNAFYNCYSLKEVTLPEEIEEISRNAFSSCTSLISISFPSSLVNISSGAFSYCSSLRNVIFSGNKLLNLGVGAFSYCTSLEKIDLPISLQFIEPLCFQNCSKLKYIKIPPKVRKIERESFNDCLSLEAIDMPQAIKSIDDSAFSGCVRLTSFILPDSLEDLEEDVFKNCKSLKEVILNKGLEKLHLSSFTNCYSLKKLYIPSSIKEIIIEESDNCVDTNKNNLPLYFEDVTISEENSVYKSYEGIVYKKCDNSIFYVPNNIKGKIDILEGCKEFPLNAFNLRNNITSLNLPKSFSSFNSSSFKALSKLSNITIDKDNQQFVSIDGIVYSKDRKSIVFIPENKSGKISIDKDLDYSSLIDSSLSCNITSIEGGKEVSVLPLEVLCRFKNLEYINIDIDNDTYKSIDGVLYNKEISSLLFIPPCYKGNINIPQSVTTCNTSAILTHYDNVTSFTVEGSNKAFYALSGVLYSKFDNSFIVLPGAMSGFITISKDYEGDKLYPVFSENNHMLKSRGVIFNKDQKEKEEGKSFINYINENCPTLSGNECIETVITGDEKLANSYSSSNEDKDILLDSILSYLPYIKEIDVEEGNKIYTSIDGILYSKDCKTLLYCPKGKEGIVIVPNSVTEINSGAFYNCKKITDIILPNSLTKIDSFAFSNCVSLENIYLPSSIKRISKGLFMHCEKLEYISLPDEIEYIDDYAFSFCSKLKSLDMPNNLLVFNTEAFYGCASNFSLWVGDNDQIKAIINSKRYRAITYKGKMNKLMREYVEHYGEKAKG